MSATETIQAAQQACGTDHYKIFARVRNAFPSMTNEAIWTAMSEAGVVVKDRLIDPRFTTLEKQRRHTGFICH